MIRNLITYCIIITLLSCGVDNDPKLPSVEEREAEAIDDLVDALQDPLNGWRLEYRPTNQTGSFLILMDFRDDGTVRVQSDLSANDGEFRDHVISYRVDSSQGIELILETYGVFHYLFEQQQASFGGEFEFLFVEESGDNLIFTSKTDGGSDVTTLIFEPAGPNDANTISITSLAQLSEGIFQSQDLGGIGNFGSYNIYVPANNHTISASFDMERRIVKFLGAAEGEGVDEIVANNNTKNLNRPQTFSLNGGNIVLDEPEIFSFGSTNYAISEIQVENFSKDVESFCLGQEDSVVIFNSSVAAGFGTFTMTSSLFQASNQFRSGDGLFAIDPIFLYDGNDNSIITQVQNVFPEVLALQWYQDFDLSDRVLNAVGFITLDEFNNAQFFLRVFEYTQVGNSYQLTFTGENFITADDPTQAQIDGLEQLTDLMFSGGNVFILELTNLDGLFEFYNPCNKYKGFLL